MRKIITEDEKEGLIKLLGEEVTLFCANYFYTGKLIGVNKTCCLLENPSIIYETGAFTDANWKDAQNMNVKEWYVRLSAVESFGVA